MAHATIVKLNYNLLHTHTHTLAHRYRCMQHMDDDTNKCNRLLLKYKMRSQRRCSNITLESLDMYQNGDEYQVNCVDRLSYIVYRICMCICMCKSSSSSSSWAILCMCISKRTRPKALFNWIFLLTSIWRCINGSFLWIDQPARALQDTQKKQQHWEFIHIAKAQKYSRNYTIKILAIKTCSSALNYSLCNAETFAIFLFRCYSCYS